MEIEKSDRCWVWDYGELCCGKHEMWDWNNWMRLKLMEYRIGIVSIAWHWLLVPSADVTYRSAQSIG